MNLESDRKGYESLKLGQLFRELCVRVSKLDKGVQGYCLGHSEEKTERTS